MRLGLLCGNGGGYRVFTVHYGVRDALQIIFDAIRSNIFFSSTSTSEIFNDRSYNLIALLIAQSS